VQVVLRRYFAYDGSKVDGAYGVHAGASRPGTAQKTALATLQEQQPQQQQQDVVLFNTDTQLLQAPGECLQTSEWPQQDGSCRVQQLPASSNGSSQRRESLPSRSASMQPAQSLQSCLEVRAHTG
jgi:hypothetical protein